MANQPIEIDVKVNGLTQIKQDLKALKGELVNATDPKDIERLSKAAGELSDKIADANEKAKVFAAGSNFEKVSNGLGLIKNQLASMDFEGAKESALLLSNTIKNMNPAEVIAGFKDFASTIKLVSASFIELGITMLANPIFLIIAVVTAIVVAIVLLKDKLYIAQVAFDLIKKPIDILIQALKDLSDWIGITSFAEEEAADKAQKSADKRVKSNKDLTDSIDKEYTRRINLAKANGEDTTKLEVEQQDKIQNINKNSLQAQKDARDKAYTYAKTFREDDRTDARNEAVKKYNEANKAYADSIELQKDSQNKEEVAVATSNTKKREEAIKHNEELAKESEKARLERERKQKEADKAEADARKRQNDLLLELEGDLNNEIKKVEDANEQAKIENEEHGKSDIQQKIDEENRTYADQLETARINNLNIEDLTLAHNNRINDLNKQGADNDKKIQDDLLAELNVDADKQIQLEKDLASAKLAIQNATLDAVGAGLGIASSFAGKSKDLQKGLLIAENAVGIAKTIINASATDGAIALKYAAIPGGAAVAAAEITANHVRAGISVATSIAATAKGLSALGGGSAGGAGGGLPSGGAPLQPKLVQNTLGNQANTAQGNIEQQAQAQHITVNAIVSETEITNKQAYISKVKSSAEI